MKIIKQQFSPLKKNCVRLIVNDGKTVVTMQTTGNWEYKFFKAMIEGSFNAKRTRKSRIVPMYTNGHDLTATLPKLQ